MKSRPADVRSRHGLALLSALSLLALLGLLVAGAFASALLDRRSGRFAERDIALSAAVDYALLAPFADPYGAHLEELRDGETRTSAVAVSGVPTVESTISVTSLPTGVLWVVADAFTADGDGHRRVSRVGRFPLAALVPGGMVTSRGDVELGPGLTFASDTSWGPECAGLAAPRIILAPGAGVQPDSAAASLRTETRAEAADSGAYLQGAAGAAALAYAGVTHFPGDFVVATGFGAGVFLVDGRVRITGPYDFSGLIIARGGIEIEGGAVIRGAVMSFDSRPGAAGVRLGSSTLRFAPCTVARALKLAAPPRPVRQRSWAELF
jgi:hypothetical protein